MKNIFKITYLIAFILTGAIQVNAAEKVDLLKTDWSFKGLFGKFDRGSLQGDIKFILRFVHRAIQ